MQRVILYSMYILHNSSCIYYNSNDVSASVAYGQHYNPHAISIPSAFSITDDLSSRLGEYIVITPDTSMWLIFLLFNRLRCIEKKRKDLASLQGTWNNFQRNKLWGKLPTSRLNTAIFLCANSFFSSNVLRQKTLQVNIHQWCDQEEVTAEVIFPHPLHQFTVVFRIAGAPCNLVHTVLISPQPWLHCNYSSSLPEPHPLHRLV